MGNGPRLEKAPPTAPASGRPSPSGVAASVEPPPSLGRSNQQWREDLAAAGSRRQSQALTDLRHYLRGGLRRGLANQTGISEADLEDFTHDAIMRILQHLRGFRGDSRFTTWAMSIAMRVAFGALRRRRHTHVSLDDADQAMVLAAAAPGGETFDPARDTERNEVLGALRSAIVECLTEKQRTVIHFELQGVASDQVALLLGTNRNAIYKVYHDARKKLRKALTEAGFRADDVRDLWEEHR